MPNGVSCLFFAGKNLIYGQKEKNLFKEGIGVIQTIRGADFIASASNTSKNATVSAASVASSGTTGASAVSSATVVNGNPIRSLLGDSAKFLKKILYPLFIVSGIYNTAKSDDKIKTGACQFSGIGVMYAFEQIAEKSLSKFDKFLNNKAAVCKNKTAKIALYGLKGMIYAGASMLGYSVGNKIAEKSVDKIRDIKNEKAIQKELYKYYSDNYTQNDKTPVFDEIETIF